MADPALTAFAATACRCPDRRWPKTQSLAVSTGSDVSWDGGRTYATFDTGTFNAVDCAPGACYAAGADGRMARLVVGR